MSTEKQEESSKNTKKKIVRSYGLLGRQKPLSINIRGMVPKAFHHKTKSYVGAISHDSNPDRVKL